MADHVEILVDGTTVTVAEGTTVAAALLQHGISSFRASISGEPRGPVCGMGTCFGCRIEIDGQPGVRSCLVLCRDGLQDQRCGRSFSPPAGFPGPAGHPGAAGLDGARGDDMNVRMEEDVEQRGTPVPVPLKPGGALFMSNLCVHTSKLNATQGSRWSIDFRYFPTSDRAILTDAQREAKKQLKMKKREEIERLQAKISRLEAEIAEL